MLESFKLEPIEQQESMKILTKQIALHDKERQKFNELYQQLVEIAENINSQAIGVSINHTLAGSEEANELLKVYKEEWNKFIKNNYVLHKQVEKKMRQQKKALTYLKTCSGLLKTNSFNIYTKVVKEYLYSYTKIKKTLQIDNSFRELEKCFSMLEYEIFEMVEDFYNKMQSNKNYARNESQAKNCCKAVAEALDNTLLKNQKLNSNSLKGLIGEKIAMANNDLNAWYRCDLNFIVPNHPTTDFNYDKDTKTLHELSVKTSTCPNSFLAYYLKGIKDLYKKSIHPPHCKRSNYELHIPIDHVVYLTNAIRGNQNYENLSICGFPITSDEISWILSQCKNSKKLLDRRKMMQLRDAFRVISA